MSMAIRRASYTGDPGFFGDIWGGIKGAVAGFAGGGRQPPIPTAGPGSIPLARNFGPANMPGNGFKIPKLFDPLGLTGPSWLDRGPATATMNGNGGAACVSAGYHPNKSDYFLKSGEFVPAGSRMVKNRKRNPANARATSRAISRVTGAKRYAQSLSRISIRKKC